jgi:ring-1,2-phenylacetyl-CoA epoxidase subunit PaaD
VDGVNDMTTEANPLNEQGRRDSLESLWEALQDVVDPEIPAVSIVEMGMVKGVEVGEDGRVTVEILPTFSGCPALDVIGQNVRARVRRAPGVSDVDVRFVFDPIWSTDRITPAGKEKLQGFGIAPAPPSRDRPLPMLQREPVACPYCGSMRTAMDNLFGPTPCRSLYHCLDCRNPFERFKAL